MSVTVYVYVIGIMLMTITTAAATLLVGDVIHLLSLVEVHVLVQGGGDGVHHKRSYGSAHGDKAREGESPPRGLAEAG